MQITHVTFNVGKADSAKALETLVEEAKAVRAMAGCIAFIPFQDATDPTQIGILHEWQTGEDFTAYTSSQEFAQLGKILRPMMLKPPVSRRFTADLIE